MPELGEGCFVGGPIKVDEPEETERIPKTVRIALFFDGTLNNRHNIEAREQATEEYEDHHDDDGGDSYDNGRTNIAILETYTGTECEGYDCFSSEYISGQGTFDLVADSIWGYTIATGGSGVPSRAKKGVQSVIDSFDDLDGFVKCNDQIKKLTIDVYGFSRGAATARYAIHLLLNDTKRPLRQRLINLGISVAEGDDVIEVGFAGLYDTVLSYLASQKSKSSNNKLEQTAVKHAKSAIHLAAAEEHRKDFPLHNIKGATNGKEFYLPGVHSDVGGSYNKASEHALEEQEKTGACEEEKVYMLPNKEELHINSGSLDEMLADISYLAEQGWYLHLNPTETTAQNEQTMRQKFEQLPYKRNAVIEHGQFILKIYYYKVHKSTRKVRRVKLYIERKEVQSAYSSIPLKIMADFAVKESGITFKSKLTKRADIIIKNAGLGTIESKLKAYVGKNKSSPDDWLNDRSLELKELRNKHLNFSARVGIGYSPRLIDGKRKRFIYDA